MAEPVFSPPSLGDRLTIEGRLYEVVTKPKFDEEQQTWSMTLQDVEYAAAIKPWVALADWAPMHPEGDR